MRIWLVTKPVTKVHGVPLRVRSSGPGPGPRIECLADMLAFTVLLWAIASTEHFPESLGAVYQVSQGPGKNKLSFF